MRASYKAKEPESRTQKKTVTFETPDQGLIVIESEHSEQESLSRESTLKEAETQMNTTRWTNFVLGIQLDE